VLHEKATTRFPADFVAKHTGKWRWLIYPWAYIEDVTSFVRALQPPPLSAEEARRRLRDDHGIRVTRQTLQDVLDFMPTSKPKGGNKP
jgi:hypoxanthine phosphoribosyltransferase